jgi:phospholipase/carboxylesterase
MTSLTGPTLPPASGHPPRLLVVLLHGYGADGADLIDLGRAFAPVLPDALFVAPNAPEPCGLGPHGFQWFALDVERIGASLAGVAGAAAVVTAYLEELWSATGLTVADTFLVGFSQGAMTALHVGTALPGRLRGIVAFSGAFVPPRGFGESPDSPPVALVHGEMDAVVEPGLSRRAAETLEAAGYDVRLHLSRGVGHGIAPDGLAFATAFLREQSA